MTVFFGVDVEEEGEGEEEVEEKVAEERMPMKVFFSVEGDGGGLS